MVLTGIMMITDNSLGRRKGGQKVNKGLNRGITGSKGLGEKPISR